MKQEEQSKKMGEIIAKCWADEGFKQRLLADANAALKAEGIEVPAGVSIKVLENTDKVINFVLPGRPRAGLSDADLDHVAAGGNRFILGGECPLGDMRCMSGGGSEYTDTPAMRCRTSLLG